FEKLGQMSDFAHSDDLNGSPCGHHFRSKIK
ncbi:MAG: hypothetical protein ACI84R_003975, partial [Candidatus Azotimanducaceae bacterium]